MSTLMCRPATTVHDGQYVVVFGAAGSTTSFTFTTQRPVLRTLRSVRGAQGCGARDSPA